VPGVQRSSWLNLIELANQYSSIYYGLGLHPAFINEHTYEDVDVLNAQLAQMNERCVALGETGLDKRYGQAAFQLELFERQLTLAKRYDLPVIIHSVGRHEDVARVLAGYSGLRGVVHAFSGSYEQARTFVDLGMHIGVGSVICRGKGKTVNAISRLPLDVLQLETDSPDMYLPSSVSKLGTPIDLLQVVERLGEMFNKEKAGIVEVLGENAKKLFFSHKSQTS